MTAFGNVRNSRYQEPGHPASALEVQRSQFIEVVVDLARI